MCFRQLLMAFLAATSVAGCGKASDREAKVSASKSGSVSGQKKLVLQSIGRFNAPIYVTAPPDDRQRVFVVEQGGRIWIVRGGKRSNRPFLDLSGQTEASGEQGLLSLAFDPEYSSSRSFYVYYTDARSGATRVVAYRTSESDADRADPNSARLILAQAQPEANHNGGQLQFGPDGMLYIGLGDGGGAGDHHGRRGNGQSLSTLLGKILRIRPTPDAVRPYAVPSSNPFRARKGARGEIYAYGLRNPWRFSFDRQTGDLVVADVGQNEWEEINFAVRGKARGANYGWRVFEGKQRFQLDEQARNHRPPVLQYPHTDGRCSVTGGYVVRSSSLAGMRGKYIYGDYCSGQLRAVRFRDGLALGDRPLGLRVPGLVSFGEDGQGRVYVISGGGPVYRLTQ